MKRSTINSVIQTTIEYLNTKQFYLPEWAYWTYSKWKENKHRCKAIFEAELGWDVSDSGKDFDTDGLTLFTIRNGILGDDSRPYCEKIIVMKKGQVAPYHYHKDKTEDIINRGEGDFAMRLATASDDNSLSNEDVTVSIDGIMHTVKAKEEIILKKGQSVVLYPYCCHQFYPVDDLLLIGEVSKVNDDHNDNYFIEEIARFPSVEEDEDILYPIVGDYRSL